MDEELIGGSSLYSEEYRQAQKRIRERSQQIVQQAEQERMSEEITVIIADDQDLVRNGFRLILSSYLGIRVVGEAADGSQACALAEELHPDVVLMDIRMPVMDGIAATQRITENPELQDVRVLILTTFDIDEYVYDALAAGASGFMLKDADPDDIEHAVRVVAQGDALIQPSITRRLVETFVSTRSTTASSDAAQKLQELTDREREILSMVAHGMSNDEIAEDLVISPATVKTHIARIMAKLEVHDRAQLVVVSYEGGLVLPGEPK